MSSTNDPDKILETKQEPTKAVDQRKAAEAKIASVETQLKSFEGKPGYNPFVWKRDNKWDLLVASVSKGDTAAIAKVLSLPATIVPKVKNEVLFVENFGTASAPFVPPVTGGGGNN